MILNFLENPIQTDYEVRAVSDEAEAHKANQGQLIVAELVPQADFRDWNSTWRTG